jgi:hypothetical protein
MPQVRHRRDASQRVERGPPDLGSPPHRPPRITLYPQPQSADLIPTSRPLAVIAGLGSVTDPHPRDRQDHVRQEQSQLGRGLDAASHRRAGVKGGRKAGGSEPLTPAHPTPPTAPTITQGPGPRAAAYPPSLTNAKARTPNPDRQAHQGASRRTATGWGRSRRHRRPRAPPTATSERLGTPADRTGRAGWRRRRTHTRG